MILFWYYFNKHDEKKKCFWNYVENNGRKGGHGRKNQQKYQSRNHDENFVYGIGPVACACGDKHCVFSENHQDWYGG